MGDQEPDCVSVGMIHGRFHPFHSGHVSYARLTWERCRFLIVGITNPDPRHLKKLPGDNARHTAAANPFTYFERYLMIQGSLLELGLQPDDFAIVPFTIDAPDLWSNYVPANVVHFLRDRGDWTRTKLDALSQAGYPAQLIEDAEGLSVEGTDIRRRIVERGDWRSLVPASTAKVLDSIKVEERLTSLSRH